MQQASLETREIVGVGEQVSCGAHDGVEGAGRERAVALGFASDEVGSADSEGGLDVLRRHGVHEVPEPGGDLVGSPALPDRGPQRGARGRGASPAGLLKALKGLAVVPLGGGTHPTHLQERLRLLGVGREALAPDDAPGGGTRDRCPTVRRAEQIARGRCSGPFVLGGEGCAKILLGADERRRGRLETAEPSAAFGAALVTQDESAV